MLRILLVENEKAFSLAVQNYFKKENYSVTAADKFETARELIESKPFEIYLVNIKLPDGNGNNLLPIIKKHNRNSIVISMSSSDLATDKIISLDLGADDYLVKPFDTKELHARMRSILRRTHSNSQENLIFNEINLLVNEYTTIIHGNSVPLTKKEFELLTYMIKNKNRLITKEALSHYLCGIDIRNHENHDFLYAHVKNLRKKLILAGSPNYIKNIHGIGYKFSEE